jgi:DMSO/TMAO reductase YedYZ molybdopterin-dependent catalytic subunit
MTPFVTPNPDFYRVDTALTLPQISPHDWTLRIHGLLARPVELSFDDLLREPMLERDITLSRVAARSAAGTPATPAGSAPHWPACCAGRACGPARTSSSAAPRTVVRSARRSRRSWTVATLC